MAGPPVRLRGAGGSTAAAFPGDGLASSAVTAAELCKSLIQEEKKLLFFFFFLKKNCKIHKICHSDSL